MNESRIEKGTVDAVPFSWVVRGLSLRYLVFLRGGATGAAPKRDLIISIATSACIVALLCVVSVHSTT